MFLSSSLAKLALPDDLHDNQDDAISGKCRDDLSKPHSHKFTLHSGLLADCKESSSKIQQCLDHIKADLK